MKTILTAGILMFALCVLPGCTDKGTQGGATSSDKKAPLTGGPAEGGFRLTVPSNLPYATSVKQGDSVVVTIGITRGTNFNDDVSLKFEGLPSGVTVDPAGAVIKHGEPDAKVTLKAADNAATGKATITVQGVPAKGETAANKFDINVTTKAVYKVSLPTLSTHVQQGGSKEFAISLSPEKGFDEDVSLSFETLPPGVTIDPPAAKIKGAGEAKFTLKATDTAGLGDKVIKVLGKSDKGVETGGNLNITIDKK